MTKCSSSGNLTCCHSEHGRTEEPSKQRYSWGTWPGARQQDEGVGDEPASFSRWSYSHLCVLVVDVLGSLSLSFYL